jgi:hypothetical protein
VEGVGFEPTNPLGTGFHIASEKSDLESCAVGHASLSLLYMCINFNIISPFLKLSLPGRLIVQRLGGIRQERHVVEFLLSIIITNPENEHR